jgi:hypothetical protein
VHTSDQTNDQDSILREAAMTETRFALYAGRALGPSKISETVEIIKGSSSIILGGKDVGKLNPDFDRSWPERLANLKRSAGIKEIYASFGGGSPVVDFETVQKIYDGNNGSFEGTSLQTNFALFKRTFPAIDGIDMDCEDNYDPKSFVAFCRMLIDMGLSITFCPYESTEFWVDALAQLTQTNVGAVTWWNLQCYAGGGGNNPQDWANEIKAKLPAFNTDRFILASDWSRFYEDDENYKGWEGHCPQDVKAHLSAFGKQACVGGAFLWNMDQILEFGPRAEGCSRPVTMNDYFNAIRDALQT